MHALTSQAVLSAVGKYHGKEITDLVHKGFFPSPTVRYINPGSPSSYAVAECGSDTAWRTIADFFVYSIPLNSASARSSTPKPFTVGLGGQLIVSLNNIAMAAYFPAMILSNRLTNQNLGEVKDGLQGDLSLVAFGEDSHLYFDFCKVLALVDPGSRHGLTGFEVASRDPFSGNEYQAWLHGPLSTAFVVPHDDLRVYSLSLAIKTFGLK